MIPDLHCTALVIGNKKKTPKMQKRGPFYEGVSIYGNRYIYIYIKPRKTTKKGQENHQKGQDNHQKNKDFYPCRTPISVEKRGKTLKKQGSPCRGTNKECRKKSKGRTGQIISHVGN